MTQNDTLDNVRKTILLKKYRSFTREGKKYEQGWSDAMKWMQRWVEIQKQELKPK